MATDLNDERIAVVMAVLRRHLDGTIRTLDRRERELDALMEEHEYFPAIVAAKRAYRTCSPRPVMT